jgi:predicted metal-dependent hydrolase
MEKQIEIQNKKINYSLKVSERARKMRLAVYCDGRCVVTIPNTMPIFFVERFIAKKFKWVVGKIDFFSKFKFVTPKTCSKKEFIENKRKAFEIAKDRVEYFNSVYKFNINKITIRNQKTRWGSCSKKGNLNFNYKIILLPQFISDYIIVHEICHLGEFNHSSMFWDLVAKTVPNYVEIKNKLKRIRIGESKGLCS